MAIKYARLFSPVNQFQLKGGQINVAGRLYVHLELTDELANLYDENGTQLTQPIILDNNGRAAGLFVDASKVYWLDVQDQYGMSQFTIRKMTPCGGGGGSLLGNTYELVSNDGSISIDKFDNGGVTTYDLGLAPQSDEFLEWIKCSDEDISNGVLYPTFVDGTMTAHTSQGLHVGKDKFYHITCTVKVDPTGAGINYETLSVNLKFNDGTDTDVVRRNYDIDNSVNDPFLCEFSYDFKSPADGYLYLLIEGVNTFEQVDCYLQVHRIYSGINAVPDTCATKQWVQETFDYNMAEKISYSALGYNADNEITGISGSALAGGMDSATVSAIASSYAESAASSKIDWSSSGTFQPSGDYAYNSSLSGFVGTGTYSAFSSEVTNNISSLSSTVSGLTGQYIEQSASGMFQPSGNYVSSTDMSGYVPFSGIEGNGGKVTGISGSAIKGHEYTGINPVSVDNHLDTISVFHIPLCVDETMTAYTSGDSAVLGVNVAGLDLSSKMDASASSLFYPSDNPSGFLTGVDLTPYQLTADMSAYAHESSLSSKLDESASSGFYPTSNPSGFLTAHQSLSGYATESYVDSAVSGKLDVTASSQFLTSLPDDLAYTSDVASAVSGKMDKSESSSFYPMDSNPSGYLTAHQSLSGYATETYVDSSVSGKLDATAYDSAEFYTTANPSGFITGVDLTPYQLTADMSGYYTTANESGFVDSAYVEGQVSGKQDVSGMTAYQPAGDYQPSGDYIYVSALGWAEV